VTWPEVIAAGIAAAQLVALTYLGVLARRDQLRGNVERQEVAERVAQLDAASEPPEAR